MEDILRKPAELTDEELDFVAGGKISIRDINIADIDQYIKQVVVRVALGSQAAVNVSSVTQLS